MEAFFLVGFCYLSPIPYLSVRELMGICFKSETLKYLFLLFSDGDTIPLSSKYNQAETNVCNHAYFGLYRGGRYHRIRFQR